MTVNCKFCGAPFEAKRKTAMFCSDTHRTLFGKLTPEQKQLKELKPPSQPYQVARSYNIPPKPEEKFIIPNLGWNPDKYRPVFDNELKTPNMPLKDTFQVFLDQFHKIIAGMPQIAKIAQELTQLRLSATNSPDLTFHQREAITARCDNYLKNDYGTQRDNKKQIAKMEQFQKMRAGTGKPFSNNGQSH